MIRFFGAVFLLAGCGGFGFSLAAAHRRETTMLRKLINALQQMEWELKFRMTELSELCRIAGMAVGGSLSAVFKEFAGKMDRQEIVDISGSFYALINQYDFPRSVRKNLKQLGAVLGRYDMEGQLQGLELIRHECKCDLKKLEENSIQRLRSYQTLALCAGAALVILFI